MTRELYSEKDKNFLIYCQEIDDGPLLSSDEEVELANQIHSSDSLASDIARHKLISSNLRLVIKVVKKYSNLGLEISDLISEGNLGLVRAVEKFDPSKGARFSTYASYWIKQSVRRALSNKSRTIRLPVHLTQLRHSVTNYAKDYETEHGSKPTEQQISEALKVPVKKLRKMKVANEINSFVFLDEKLDSNNDDDDRVKSDTTEDYHAQAPDKIASKDNDLFVLQQEMDSELDEREKYIIHHRFGLKNLERHTLEQVGDKFGLTRERIRQIEQAALKKLHRKLEKKMA